MFWKKKKKEEGDAESQEFSDEEVDHIMDEAEASDSLDEESKPRSKNTKVATIGFIALVLLAGIYFGSKNYPELLVHKDNLLALVGFNKETPENPEIPAAPPPAAKEHQEPPKPAAMEADKKPPEPRPETREAKPRLNENVAQEVHPSEPPKPRAEAPAVHPEKTPARAEESPREKAKAPAAPPSPPPATTSSGKYAIQVGTFSIKENAVKLIQKLTESGYEAYGVPISVSGSRQKQKNIHAGPFYSKLEAEEAEEELRKNDVPSARVVYDKGEASYRVEVGNPSTVGAAERLKEKIRRLGYQDGGSKSTRGGDAMTAVYVGNFADKDQAEEVRKKLPKEDVPSSWVVVAPSRG